MSAFEYFTKIAGLIRATAQVQRRQPGAKLMDAWQLCASTDHQWQAVHRRYKYGQWLRLLQVEPVMHGMNGNRNLAHDFIIKLSPCTCTCSYVAALAGEMAGTCRTVLLGRLKFVTNTATRHDKLVNQQAKTVSKPVNGCACRRVIDLM